MAHLMLPLLEIAKMNNGLFLNCLADVDETLALQRPTDKTNNINFIACHLLDARFYWVRYWGQPVTNPLQNYFDQINSIEQMQKFPRLEQIKTEWQKISVIFLEQLTKLTDDFLLGKAKTPFFNKDETELYILSFTLEHESYHIGQLAFLRKYFGLPAMKYS